MRFRLILGCFLAISMALWGIAFGADKIIYSQDFDELDDGDIHGQDGWESIDSLTAGLGSLTVQGGVTLTGSGKALQAEAFQETHIKWPEPVETGTCYLSIFFRKENVDAGNTLHIYMGKGALAWSAGPVVRIGSQSGGGLDEVGVHDGADDVIVQPAKYKIGKWHHIREVIDVDKMSFEIFFDGKNVGKFDFRNASHTTIEWLMIGFDEGIGLLGYYDAIEFGLGTGEQAFTRATPVESAGKLGTTWGTVKGGY
ncbi:hypothetical protein ACFL6S_06110 [Candidatus Poribacteria bacterium]